METKQLDIDFYTNGIGEVEFNCIDIPIAAACGAYNQENYFYYLLQICVSRNWKRKDGKKDLLAQYMENLGLRFERIQTKANDLIGVIINCINKNCPVLLPVTYHEMFFTTRYKRNTASHFLLVEGYMQENEILLLREELHFISSERLKEQKGLYPLRLKNDMVISMWRDSQELLTDRLKDAVFTIRKEPHSAKINGIKTFLEWMLENYMVQEDLFAEKLIQLSRAEDTNLEEIIFNLRSDFHKYMYAFFYLLKDCIKNKVEKNLFEKLVTLENAFLEFREITIAKFHVSRIKGYSIAADDIREQSERYNQSLYVILEQIYEQIKFYKEEVAEAPHENMACRAFVSASSSEEKTIKGPERVLEDDQEIWKSQKGDGPHWIMFQFPEPVCIHEMEIWHHKEAHKMTVDFTIQGSMDGTAWENLECVEENHQPVTEHYFENARYIYYRIYITLPALRNNAAIIRYVSMK